MSDLGRFRQDIIPRICAKLEYLLDVYPDDKETRNVLLPELDAAAGWLAPLEHGIYEWAFAPLVEVPKSPIVNPQNGKAHVQIGTGQIGASLTKLNLAGWEVVQIDLVSFGLPMALCRRPFASQEQEELTDGDG